MKQSNADYLHNYCSMYVRMNWYYVVPARTNWLSRTTFMARRLFKAARAAYLKVARGEG